jgi:hypothetical protein
LKSVIGTAVMVGGKVYFSKPEKTERNRNAGTLEPWNLLLGCKAG